MIEARSRFPLHAMREQQFCGMGRRKDVKNGDDIGKAVRCKDVILL
jgi:hypothetical protein